MASVTKERAGGGLSGSEADIRHRQILDTLYERHPESKEILIELDDLFGDLWVEAEEEGVRRQCLLLRAVIDGDVMVSDDGLQGIVAL